jgi:hypothetical protein
MSGDKEPGPSELSPEIKGALESLFAGLPEAYGERYEALQALRQSFYRELAKHLQPVLNAQAKNQPHGTLQERSALASWINRTVRHAGLSLVCPRTNQPAILFSGTSGRSRTMRFYFQITDESGKQVRTVGSEELPDLELGQARIRIENFAKEYRGREGSERFR